MSAHLYLAPAGCGKTAYLVERVRRLARDPARAPRILVPTSVQTRAWRRHLAGAGGALGVRVTGFRQLYRELLDAAGCPYVTLTDPIRFRLLRALLDELDLVHYAPLRRRPGFVQALIALVDELKAGRVLPEALREACEALGGEPRLVELALIYAAYQERLQREGWADEAGLGWLAAEELEGDGDLGADWSFLGVDGFDDLTSVQLDVLAPLVGRVGEVVVTLEGEGGSEPRKWVHRRALRTRRRLEEALGVVAEPLPQRRAGAVPTLRHLEASLFNGEGPQLPAEDAVTLVAAPDRAAEVRAALRWLKARLVRDGFAPGEVALLARRVDPYRPYLRQSAAEFGLPVHFLDGQPLNDNPAVAAFLDLLRLSLPERPFPWRPTVDAWRSPYFDWARCLVPGTGEVVGIEAGDAEALGAVARWGRVIGGREQWEEAFASLAGLSSREDSGDEERDGVPANVPTGSAAAALRDKFRRFARRLAQPAGGRPCREHVAWLEELLGRGPEEDEEGEGLAVPTPALGLVRVVVEGPLPLAERDLAALNALKDVLRGLVWAEEAVGCGREGPRDFPTFFRDLLGAVEAAAVRQPLPSDRQAVLVAAATAARGVPFRAVALLGLAEGEFPTTLSEDPLLRDADRRRLREGFDLSLDDSTESAEVAYFYDAVTRPREALLLTRPRIAEDGAPWQPSPFWEEVRRRVAVEVERLTSESRPAPAEAASWPEMLLAASELEDAGLWAWVDGRAPELRARLDDAVALLGRRAGSDPGPFDGDLTQDGPGFARRFGPSHTWSASRLESYRTCPFSFFVAHVLRLEERAEPVEGLDARQLGNLYHRLLEEVYGAVADPTELEALLAALPEVAGRVLDEAPRREGFRATAWWERRREEMVEEVRASLEALAALEGEFVPHAHEAPFGLDGAPRLVVPGDDGDAFAVRGLIDRVDRSPQGQVRVIDYKTAGPSGYSLRAVREGKKLQLPLYALAAREALRLGDPVEGFYWHVRHAEASSFTLAKYGPEAAVEAAVAYAWEAVRGARGGAFVPRPPDGGCPAYCPASGFCWHYEEGFRW
jgi:ATP-dependent helicase/nuclease subunit B